MWSYVGPTILFGVHCPDPIQENVWSRLESQKKRRGLSDPLPGPFQIEPESISSKEK